MRAIVLSGGGGKGSYQFGVWRALRRLHINYDIVTGTSIGALNGLMMVQGDYLRCLNLWNTIDFTKIYDDFNKENIYKSYLGKIIEGGIDTKKIEELIESIYNPKKLYNSHIKYGIVSVNLSNKNVVYSTTRNTSPTKLKKYILASATCYPVFKPTEVEENLFIDGGYYDNLPINLAIDLGATEVIAVDLKAIGLKKTVKNTKVKVTYIKPRNKLASFLAFERESAIEMIRFGYNDTMKTFKKLEGIAYTFKKGSLIYNQQKYYPRFQELVFKYLNKKVSIKEFNDVVEESLATFKIDASKIYNRKNYLKDLNSAFNNHLNIDINTLNIKEIKKLFDRRTIVKNICYRILKSQDFLMFKIMKREFLVALYLLTIRS